MKTKVKNIRINIEFGHTKEEWKKLCLGSHNGQPLENDYWDFSAEDLLNGAIEPEDNMTYWLIEGRLYETPENN